MVLKSLDMRSPFFFVIRKVERSMDIEVSLGKQGRPNCGQEVSRVGLSISCHHGDERLGCRRPTKYHNLDARQPIEAQRNQIVGHE